MDLPGFLSGITFAANAYKAAVELRDEAQIIAATHDLQAQLVIAGAHCLEMNAKVSAAADSERAALTRIHHLEDQIRKLEQRLADRERYQLVEEHPGTFTFRLKEACRNGEPIHHLCSGCLDNKDEKSILQAHGASKTVLKCPACQTTYRMADTSEDAVVLRHGRERTDWSGFP